MLAKVFSECEVGGPFSFHKLLGIVSVDPPSSMMVDKSYNICTTKCQLDSVYDLMFRIFQVVRNFFIWGSLGPHAIYLLYDED